MKAVRDDAAARTVLVTNLRWAEAWAVRLAKLMADARGFEGCAEAKRLNRIDPTPLTYGDLDKLRDGLAAVRGDLGGLLDVEAEDVTTQGPKARARALGLRVLPCGRTDPSAAA